MPRTSPSAPGWCRSAGGTCRSSTRASRAEHQAVRTAAGLFDVSHMGQIELAGPNALAAVQHLTSNDAAEAPDGAGAVLGADHARRHVRRRRAGLPDGAEPLPAGGQRLEHREGPRLDRRQRLGGRRGGDRQRERPLRADCGAGPQGPRHRPVAHRRAARRPSSTTGSRTARSPASAAPCRAPATPARTATRSSCRRSSPRRCGTRCCRRARSTG